MSLGVSQYAIENEYYVIDLPEIIDRKRKQDAQQRLLLIGAITAGTSVQMQYDDYKRLVNGISMDAGADKQANDSGFDREGFERLRTLTNMGANRIG